MNPAENSLPQKKPPARCGSWRLDTVPLAGVVYGHQNTVRRQRTKIWSRSTLRTRFLICLERAGRVDRNKVAGARPPTPPQGTTAEWAVAVSPDTIWSMWSAVGLEPEEPGHNLASAGIGETARLTRTTVYRLPAASPRKRGASPSPVPGPSKMGPHMQKTAQEIESARTEAGGWTKKTLASWGIPWPPPRGWRAALEGRDPNEIAPSSPIQANLEETS